MEVATPATARSPGLSRRPVAHAGSQAAPVELRVVLHDEGVVPGVDAQRRRTGVVGVLDQLQRHDPVALQRLQRLLNVPAEVRLVAEVRKLLFIDRSSHALSP